MGWRVAAVGDVPVKVAGRSDRLREATAVS